MLRMLSWMTFSVYMAKMFFASSSVGAAPGS
jgi:hypothetical protein